MPTVHHYFVSANTAGGFRNFFPEALEPLQRVFILKGGPGTGKSTLMKKLGRLFWEMGEEVDYLHCSSDPDSLDGVLFSARKAAVVDGTAPHVVEPTAPGAKEEYVNLGVLWDRKKLSPHREEILRNSENSREYYEKMREQLKEAEGILLRRGELFRENTDHAALNQLTRDLSERIFGNLPKQSQRGRVLPRFCHAITTSGEVSFLEALTETVENRCFLRGEAGFASSSVLQKLVQQGKERGYLVEDYRDVVCPEKTVLVRLPELSFAVLGRTRTEDPSPDRRRDWQVDLSREVIRPGTQEENHELLALFQREVEEKLHGARECLAKAREHHDRMEEVYGEAVDFAGMEGIFRELKEGLEE